MKFSWDYHQKLQYSAVVAVITMALSFVMYPVISALGLVILIYAIYVMFFMERNVGYVKPWKSYGFVMLTFIGNAAGDSLARLTVSVDVFSLLFLGLFIFFIHLISANHPVDVEY